MKNDKEISTRTRWGYVNFTRRRIPAMAIAIPTGLLLGGATAAIVHAIHLFTGPHATAMTLALALFLTFNFFLLTWIIVVDRSTLRGAVSNPEESVENTWYATAAVGTLHDLLIALGVGGAALILTDTTLDARLALLALLGMAMLDTFVRYNVARKRG